jgi:sulfite exporter TauE/SafE
MSLKAFHLIFVTLLTALAFGCAGWAFAAGRPVFGVSGIVAGILVIIYGIYFLKKLKRISYL